MMPYSGGGPSFSSIVPRFHYQQLHIAKKPTSPGKRNRRTIEPRIKLFTSISRDFTINIIMTTSVIYSKFCCTQLQTNILPDCLR